MKSKKWIFVLCNFLASFFLVACQSGSNGSQSAVDAIKQKGKPKSFIPLSTRCNLQNP
ncbi:ABC transporter substrate-binding lipoprotein [Streptococcus pneumoniae]|nr:ABC transporter substrate-binding lipoprotein [Streptococcus pneumoniae]